MDLPAPASPLIPLPSSTNLLNQARTRAGQSQTVSADPNAPPAAPQPTEEMRRVGREFESMFVSEMLKPMFEGLKTDDLGGGGVGEDTWRPMLIERYGEAITKTGGVGIADAVARELMRMQEAHNLPAPQPEAHPIPIPASSERSDHGAHG